MAIEKPALDERYALTVEEAAIYFCIGQKKIRQIAEEHLSSGIAFTNGNRLTIKRKAFEAFLNQLDSV